MMTIQRGYEMMFCMIICASVAFVSPHLPSTASIEAKRLRLETILHRTVRGLETDARDQYSEMVEHHKISTKPKAFRSHNGHKNTSNVNDTLRLNRQSRTTNLKIGIDKLGLPLLESRDENISKSPSYIKISRWEDSNDEKGDQKNSTVSKSFDENATIYTVANDIQLELVTTTLNVENSSDLDTKYHIKYVNNVDKGDNSSEFQEPDRKGDYWQFPKATESQHLPVDISANSDHYASNRRFVISTNKINGSPETTDSKPNGEYQQSIITVTNYQNQFKGITNNPDNYVDNRRFVNGTDNINDTPDSEDPEIKNDYQLSSVTRTNNQNQLEDIVVDPYNIVDRVFVNGADKTSDNSESGKIEEKGDYQQSSMITPIFQHQSRGTLSNQRDDVDYRRYYREPVLITIHENQPGNIGSSQYDVANTESVNEADTTNNALESRGLHGKNNYGQSFQIPTELKDHSGVTTNNDTDAANSLFIPESNKTDDISESVNYRENNWVNSTDIYFPYKTVLDEKDSTTNSSSNNSVEQFQNMSFESRSPPSTSGNIVNSTNRESDDPSFNESVDNVQEMDDSKKDSTIKEETATTANIEQSEFLLHYRDNNDTVGGEMLQEVVEGFVRHTNNESNTNEMFDTHSGQNETTPYLNKRISYNLQRETEDNRTMPFVVGENIDKIPEDKFNNFRSSEDITSKFEEADFNYPSTELNSSNQQLHFTRKLYNELKLKAEDKEQPETTNTNESKFSTTASNDNEIPAIMNFAERKVPPILQRYRNYRNRNYLGLGPGLLL